MKEYIYVLKLIPRLVDVQIWNEEDEKLVADHFCYLKTLLSKGKLILAGRTTIDTEDSFGIVIFRAEDDEKAREIAHNDPAVVGKIMKCSVFPYKVALIEN